MTRQEKYILWMNLNKVFNTLIKKKHSCIVSVEINPTIFVQQFNLSGYDKKLKIVLTLKDSGDCMRNKKEIASDVNIYIKTIKDNVMKMVKFPFHNISYVVDVNFL